MATYVLVLNASNEFTSEIGKLGRVGFKKGHYLYIGSAKRGLTKRLERHLKGHKKPFWHIDYVLNGKNIDLKCIWTKEADEECKTAGELGMSDKIEVVRDGLGSSDCRCLSHFFRYRNGERSLEVLLKDSGFKKWLS